MQKLKIIFMSIFSLITLCTNAEPASVVRVRAIVNNEAVTLGDYNKYILKTGSSASSEFFNEIKRTSPGSPFVPFIEKELAIYKNNSPQPVVEKEVTERKDGK
jgi:hypothetical protein